ncbi:valine--tRNA ligase [Candidatus Methylomirabilis sp.]|uniref:valine--tRNA ligase n=1 Tax=Candidatus Methylomirabilis sp. TaxID=2032687 RepID=UPI002A693B76|nr:valine--tRNA ligase [Candidatus Methylomirabilis sp.]
MTEPEMPRTKKTGYDPYGIEERWAKVWEATGSSHVDESSPKPPYAIVIPPPNITGFLHIGHAMNNTLQDILIRWRRMQGYNALWIPGTDHAGIATQNVVERQLQEEGRRREDLGRTGFVDRVWRWKAESGGTIIRQLKRLGASCDWERECFTMDEDRQQAVREVFVRLYDDGLIYRGERLINWCPRCQTALSDIEVEYEDTQGSLYHIRYPMADDPETALIVATTRPETMLGDTAVAVHPDDARYNRLIGRQVRLPLTGRTIPVVGDSILVDREFGTGAVKITPAHDFNDFEAGERHGLPRIALFTRKGRISPAVQPEARIDPALFKEVGGKPVAVARERVLDRLRQEGLLEKVEPHLHALGKCYRCRSVVEPFLSTQWFVKVKPLAEPAIRAVEDGRTRFVPEHWENTYFAWMRNIKDWCISRQLWWGHQIPAWYCKGCDADNIFGVRTGVESGPGRPVLSTEVWAFAPEARPIVSAERPAGCPRCGSQQLIQDPDVLDTWFSSALWPFSTMGWPKQSELLTRFYPTSTLVTSFDIIFFWVARMMMMGLKFREDVPFREVYIHALVRDAEGQKMSKSKGNVIDPLEIIDKYGADAFRFTLAALAAQGRDIRLSEERIEGYRHFCNKLWNANQFLARHLPLLEGSLPPVSSLSLDLADRWLLSRLHELIGSVTKALEEYRFNEAASALYQFVWHEYCDWYVEIVKARLSSDASREQRLAGVALLCLGLDTALRLLHPFMPFITEEIWQQLPQHGSSLMVAEWPKGDPGWQDANAEASINFLMDLARATRDLRSDLEIAPSKSIRLVLRTSSDTDDRAIDAIMPYLVALTRAEQVTSGQHLDRPSPAAVALVGGIEVHLPVDDLSVFAVRQQKLQRELEKLEQELARVDKKLNNPNFLLKAPEEVVTKEREEHTRLMNTRNKHLQHLERIEQFLR